MANQSPLFIDERQRGDEREKEEEEEEEEEELS